LRISNPSTSGVELGHGASNPSWYASLVVDKTMRRSRARIACFRQGHQDITGAPGTLTSSSAPAGPTPEETADQRTHVMDVREFRVTHDQAEASAKQRRRFGWGWGYRKAPWTVASADPGWAGWRAHCSPNELRPPSKPGSSRPSRADSIVDTARLADNSSRAHA